MNDVSAALLGMPGFRVLAVDDSDADVQVMVETTATVVGCPGCGVVARSKGRRMSRLRDLPLAGRQATIWWHKRRWFCPDTECDTKSWTEQRPDVAVPGRRLTVRAASEAARQVGEDARSVAEVARSLGVGWHTVMRAVLEAAARLLAVRDLSTVRALGVDETAFLKATRTHGTWYVTTICDLAGRVLDVVWGNSRDSLGGWLAAQDSGWLAGIGMVAIDPHAGYARALRDGLPHAVVVVDHFHAVKLANTVIDDVRRRVQQDTLGHRGRKGDPLYGIRRLLLVGHERLTGHAEDRILTALAAGDPDFEVASAWTAKELVRSVYRAPGLNEAKERLTGFYDWANQVDVPEVSRLARTLRQWQDPVLAYHTTGISNGPTEALNLLVKKVKRSGHGFRNHQHYRTRILLHCGRLWHTPHTRLEETRPPRTA